MKAFLQTFYAEKFADEEFRSYEMFVVLLGFCIDGFICLVSQGNKRLEHSFFIMTPYDPVAEMEMIWNI